MHIPGKMLLFRLLQQKQTITQQTQNESNKTMEFKSWKTN